MRRSWRKRVAVLLLALLVMVGLFLGWTSFNYTSRMRKTVDEENARSAALWASMTEARLGTVYEHVYELLIALYNNTELRADTPVMGFRARSRILDMMSDKLLASDNSDVFFVLDTQNDYFLFSAKNSMSVAVVLQLKAFAHDSAPELSRDLGDRGWTIHPIGNGAWFMKSVRLGKYVVGAFSSAGHYMAEGTVNIIGNDSACLLDDGQQLYFFGGDEDISGELDPEMLRNDRPRSVSVVSAPVALLDSTVYITSHAGSIFAGNSTTAVLLLIDALVCLFLVIYLLFLLRRKVAKPTAELMEANQKLASGETDYRLDAANAGSREFEALYDSYNDMASQIVSLRIEAYDMKLAEEKNKLTMLRAQLKPHTFLNAITTISNMTYSNRPEEIRAYIADFAKFVRYMLKTTSPWTTVEEELKNIRSYLNMQERRSPDSIHLTAECEPEAAGARIPFLLLFTLVENSIKHAMTLYSPMELLIRCETVADRDFNGVRLTVEDNGDGFPPEVMEKFLEGRDDPVFTKEHLGLSNVRYTLNLVYHRRDLLRLGKSESGGARVEIWIPEVPNDEASDL